jgi:hypothetical protein
MSNTKRIERLKQESKELTRQGGVLEAVEKFNEAWNLQFSETKPKIRPEIMAFAEAMEAEMAERDSRSGERSGIWWKSAEADSLAYSIHEHWRNLDEALDTPIYEKDTIINEATDIANFAMMIWYKTKGEVNAKENL